MTKRLSPREREKIPRAEGKKGEAKNKTKKRTREHHPSPSGTRDEGVHISHTYIYIAHVSFSRLLPFFGNEKTSTKTQQQLTVLPYDPLGVRCPLIIVVETVDPLYV